MRKLLLTGLSVLTLSTVLAACQPTQSQTSETSDTAVAIKAVATNDNEMDANAKLDAWFETKFMEGVRRYPQFLAQLGIKERTDEWNDPSRSFALEQLDQTRQDLEELHTSFNVDDLDASHALSYRLYTEQAQDELAAAKWWHHRYSCLLYTSPSPRDKRQSRMPSSA